MDTYILLRGRRGALRLEVLAQAAGPGSQALLRRLPWRDHWRSLDVGCGLGHVTRELARRGRAALGVDLSPYFVDWARQAGGADYQVLDAGHLSGLTDRYEVVYARYLLSHLADPQAMVQAMVDRLTPAGWLVLEDIDFPAHSCDPPCPAFERYVELYQALVSGRGGDARLGRRLWRLAEDCGLEVTYSGVHLPLFRGGVEKRVAELTLAHIAPGLVDQGLATRQQVAQCLRELRVYRRSGSQMSLAPTFQLIARKV